MSDPYPNAGPAGVDGNDALSRSFLTRDDLGNGKRLMAVYGEDMVHVEKRGWIVWTGQIWDGEHGDKLAMMNAWSLADLVAEEAAAQDTTPIKKAEIDAVVSEESISAAEAEKKIRARRKSSWTAYLKKCRNKDTVERALKYFQVFSLGDRADFDREVLKLVVANGTIDLEKLPPADAVDIQPEEMAAAFDAGFHREDRAMRRSMTPYDPAATCPQFAAFIEMIMPAPEMRAYLQMVFGYCLSGSVSEQAVFLFQGEGGNGKSMLLTVIGKVLGDYSTVTPIETFLRDKNRTGASAAPDVARLAGARMARASEPRKGDVLDEGRIKEFSSGEPMAVRELYGKFFEFEPQSKLFLSFNRTPSVYSDDDGTWRRIHVVPFSVQIPRDQRRPFKLVERDLLSEASGILNWMLDGWRMYEAAGRIERPEEVERASDELRESLDTIGQYLTDCCVKGNDEEARFADLYAVYEKWATRLGDKPISRKALAKALSDKGYRNGRGGKSKSAMRAGLRLRYRHEVNEDIGSETFAEWLRDAGVSVDGPIEGEQEF